MKNVLELFKEYTNVEIKENPQATTEGGEWKTSCPICGVGDDRLWIQPNKGQAGRWKCRVCNKGGNAVSFCTEILRMPETEMGKIMRFLKEGEKREARMVKPVVIRRYKPSPVTEPTKEWIETITKITQEAHNNLIRTIRPDYKKLNLPPILVRVYGHLHMRGIKDEVLKEFLIGFNPTFITKIIDSKETYIPPGITIPFMTKNEVRKLKIKSHINEILENPDHRFSTPSKGRKGLTHILRNTDNFIIVEAELDMYTLYSNLGNNFSYIATGSNVTLPDSYIHPFIKNCTNLLICHDNDPAGTTMYIRWKKEYPKAIATPTPKGKDPGEAVALNVNLKQFFLDKI